MNDQDQRMVDAINRERAAWNRFCEAKDAQHVAYSAHEAAKRATDDAERAWMDANSVVRSHIGTGYNPGGGGSFPPYQE